MQEGEPGRGYDPYTEKAGYTPPPSRGLRPSSAAAVSPSTLASGELEGGLKPHRPGSAGVIMGGVSSVEVRQLLDRLQSSDLKRDPTLAAALATLASRVDGGIGRKLGPQTRLRLGLSEREK